jgi:hypothetical protein
MATERRYVLRTKGGCYITADQNEKGITFVSVDYRRAALFDSVHDAYAKAQRLVRFDGLGPDLRAVPVERETERTVKEVERDRLYVLRNAHGSFVAERDYAGTSLRCARRFTPTDLLDAQFPTSENLTPIPVEVTEAPGPWRVAESERNETWE